METKFKAVALTGELNLNTIAGHFGIQRKFKWEDILGLREDNLQGILGNVDGKKVYLFHFGAAVFINLQHHEMMDVVMYLQRITPELEAGTQFVYEDDYSLVVEQDSQPSINNDWLVTREYAEYKAELIATVLAKSVALEKNEAHVDLLLDRVESVVNSLQAGQLGVSDAELGKMTAAILRFRLGAISNLMILDNPDITWNNVAAADLYNELAIVFELKERYGNLQHKTQTLMDITDSFADLAHAKRSTRLEWIIIILIAFEIVLSLYEMFVR